MFKKQKRILEENNKVLEKIEKEKAELLEIKRILEEKCDKINITNIFVFDRNGYYNIVEYKSKKIYGTTNRSGGRVVEGYHGELIDIFSNVIVYEKNHVEPIGKRELVNDRYGQYTAFLHHVTEVDRNLLKYVDNMVPKIELQKLFYRLNKIELVDEKKLEKRR